MPFALVAVVLLLITSYSVVIIADIEDSDARLNATQDDIENLESAVRDTVVHVRSLAASVLQSIAKEGLSLEVADIEPLFGQRVSEILADRYPHEDRGIERHILNHDLSLRMVHLSDDPAGGGGSYPAFIVVTGQLTIAVSTERSNLTSDQSFEAQVPVPLPLLNSILSDHLLSIQGGRSELSRLVSYQLGSLAQLRVLNGAAAVGDATPLVNDEEVVSALESSLDMLERKNLRTQAGSTPLPDTETVVDAAELLLSDMEVVELDMNQVLSQSLFSIIDSTVLSWLEYLDFLRVPIGFLESLQGDLLHALDHLFYKAGFDMQAVRYLKDRMADNSHSEHEYRYLNPTGAMVLDLPCLTLIVGDEEDIQSFDLSPGITVIEVPKGDILGNSLWKSFFPIYRQSTLEITRSLQELLRDVAQGISSSHQLPVLELTIDPYDDTPLPELITQAMEGHEDAIRSALMQGLQAASQGNRLSDPVSLELLAFIERYRYTLFGEDILHEHLIESVIDSYMEELREGTTSDGISVNLTVAEDLRDGIRSIMTDGEMRELIDQSTTANGDRIFGMFSEVLMGDERSPSGISATLASLASGLMYDVPELSEGVLDTMSRIVKDIARTISVTHADPLTPLPAEGLTLQDGSGQVFMERMELDRELEIDRIVVLQPHQVRGGAIHHIGLEDWGLAPYSSTVIVRVEGTVDYGLHSGKGHPLMPLTAAMMQTPLDMELRISVSSGWPLQGVQYSPSNTLGGDIALEVMRNVLPLMSHLEGSFAACDALFRFIATMNSKINAFVTDVMSTLADAVLSPIFALQEALEAGLASFLGDMMDKLLDNAGVIRWNMDFMGLRLEFETNPLQFALGMSRDILRATLSMNVSDVHLSVTLRLLKMGSGDYYVLGTANMAMSDWYVSMTLDPSMRVFRHLVEAKGTIGDVGFNINFPQIMQYESFGLRLSQIPALGAFLSNIPLPIPGMRGSIDAGLEIKYDVPTATNIVINEVESNPPGPDSGNEWVEIYNPLNRDVELNGWTITNGKGGGRHMPLPDMTLSAGERYVHFFPTRTLVNGDSMTLPRGDSVLLWDHEGALVDSTPWLVDTYDDDRTWQREYDGADRWVFESSKQGISNGPPSKGADLGQWFVSELRASAMSAMGKVSMAQADMDAFSDFLHETLETLLDRILQRMASCIVEMRLFIFMGVSDLSSSLSAGLELSLVAGREFVLEGLRWMAASLRQAVSDALNPGNSYPQSTGFLMAESHIRLTLITRVGAPDFMGRLTDDDSYEMRSMVEMNLASIGSLMGKAHEDRRVGFGVMFSGVPGVVLPSMFKVDPGRNVDVWMMKGTFTF